MNNPGQQIGEVSAYENQIQALQKQVLDLKASSEKWEPKVSTSMETDGTCKVSLKFGGKMVTATMSSLFLASTDVTSATSSVVDTLCSSLVVDRLREVVQPEVQKLINNAVSLQGAGKW